MASPSQLIGHTTFGNLTHCQITGAPSPNSDATADAAASTLSHELSEAITDPLLNAWRGVNTSQEIGDLCAYCYGYLGWDSGKANEFWNGHYYLRKRNTTIICTTLTL